MVAFFSTDPPSIDSGRPAEFFCDQSGLDHMHKNKINHGFEENPGGEVLGLDMLTVSETCVRLTCFCSPDLHTSAQAGSVTGLPSERRQWQLRSSRSSCHRVH